MINKKRLSNRIKKHEGYSRRAYLDQLGNLTIGYGHLIRNKEEFETGKKYSTNAWRRIVYDEYGDPWVAEMLYDPDVVDKSGARVKLELRRLR